jgi:hypothetical protein
MIGTNTVPASAAMPRWRLDNIWYSVMGSVVAGVMGGVWIVLA